jgi:hypothetical protein
MAASEHVALGFGFALLAIVTLGIGILFLVFARPVSQFLEGSRWGRWKAKVRESHGVGPPLVDPAWNVRIIGALEILLGLTAALGALFHLVVASR